MNPEMEVDSTNESETSVGGVQAIDRQGIIEHYTTVILQKLVWGPFSSIPEIITTLQYAGPFDDRQDIYEAFGGRRNLMRTIKRMNAVRRAALQGRWGICRCLRAPLLVRKWDTQYRARMSSLITGRLGVEAWITPLWRA